MYKVKKDFSFANYFCMLLVKLRRILVNDNMDGNFDAYMYHAKDMINEVSIKFLRISGRIIHPLVIFCALTYYKKTLPSKLKELIHKLTPFPRYWLIEILVNIDCRISF
jgi:hypothetical protein